MRIYHIMKALILLLSLLSVFSMSSCYMATLPPGPGFVAPPRHGYHRPYSPSPYNPAYRGGVWQTGYDFGRSDRARGLSYNPARYRSRVSEKHRPTFYAGYRDGYEGGMRWGRR